MQPLFKKMRPMLESMDVQETIAFYTGKLGFTVDDTWEHGGIIKWATIYKEEFWLMFTASTPGNQRAPAMTGDIYIYTDDINELWSRVKDNCEVTMPIQDMPYGMRELAIKDNNGYILKFGQAVSEKSGYEKLFPPSLTLETSRVMLRLLQPEDAAAMKKITAPAIIWKYFTKNLADDAELTKWINDALQERVHEKRMPFAIIDKDSMNVCGSTSLGNISLYDKRMEIGWTWLGTEYMGTGINRHAKFVLLSYAFDVAGMERVEIKTDNLNERSKAALHKIGAWEEGVLKSHMLMHDGRRRDSAYYSYLKEDWPKVKEIFFNDIS